MSTTSLSRSMTNHKEPSHLARWGSSILVHLAVSIESTTPSRFAVWHPLHVGDWGILGIESSMSNTSLNNSLKPYLRTLYDNVCAGDMITVTTSPEVVSS